MDIKQILKQQNFKFNKQFGQNFLTDQSLLADIVDKSGIQEDTTVLEIGAGAGTLTRELAKNAKRVVAFEIDRNLKSVLDITTQEFSNVEIIVDDIMKYSMTQIEQIAGGKFVVVANIPYYLTSPLIMMFIEQSQNVVSLTLTIQKEVADRLASRHNTSDYGAITVAVQSVADVEITANLSRELFYPVPNVDSAVIQITLNRNKFNIEDMVVFKKTVKSAFAMRRKTLVNNLVNSFQFSKEQATSLLAELNLSPTIRGEALSVEQFVQLANTIAKNII